MASNPSEGVTAPNVDGSALVGEPGRTEGLRSLRDLEAKLAVAVGPARELDRDIFWLTDRKNAERYFWNASTSKPRPLGEKLPNGLGKCAVEFAAPAYTSSNDAALTLKPKGFTHASGDCDEDDSPWACLTDAEGNDFSADAFSEAAALSLAAIRARIPNTPAVPTPVSADARSHEAPTKEE